MRAQRLDAERPTDLVELVKWLGLFQIDPIAAIAPNADLVAWSRLGSSYQPDHLTTAIEEERTLFEFNALVRPTEDLPLFLADMEGRPRSKEGRQWLEANTGFRRDILARLEQSGPLLSRDIPDTSSVPWKSMGRTHNRNVTLMLEVLMMRGEIPSPATRPASAYGIWLNGSVPGGAGPRRGGGADPQSAPAAGAGDCPPVDHQDAARAERRRRGG